MSTQAQGEQGFADVVSYLPADPQAAEPVQVGKGAFHDPALGARTGAVPGAAAGDQWLHAKVPDQAAVLVVVVAAVREDHVGAAPGPAALAPHWWHCLKQRDQPGDVVAVAAGQDGDERDAGGVGEQVVLAAGPAPVDRASSGLGAPFTARMWEPSTAAWEKSRVFALRSLARRTSCSRGHARASVHSSQGRGGCRPPSRSTCLGWHNTEGIRSCRAGSRAPVRRTVTARPPRP